MKDESFLTFGNLFDAGMEENIFCSGCEPVGDALLLVLTRHIFFSGVHLQRWLQSIMAFCSMHG